MRLMLPSAKRKKNSRYLLIIICIFLSLVFLLSLFTVYSVKNGMGKLFLQKIGLETKRVTDRKDYWAIEGWNRTLEGLRNCSNTVIFFGNSITYYGQWEKAFNNYNGLSWR